MGYFVRFFSDFLPLWHLCKGNSDASIVYKFALPPLVHHLFSALSIPFRRPSVGHEWEMSGRWVGQEWEKSPSNSLYFPYKIPCFSLKSTLKSPLIPQNCLLKGSWWKQKNTSLDTSCWCLFDKKFPYTYLPPKVLFSLTSLAGKYRALRGVWECFQKQKSYTRRGKMDERWKNMEKQVVFMKKNVYLCPQME